MVKNALQAQLLKAGLVDQKKAKKMNKQSQHQQRLGVQNDADLKAELAQAQQEKLAKDQALDLEKQRILQEKGLKANIEQMIQQHRISDSSGDIAYQFIHLDKIKKVYVSQAVYNALVTGSLCIAYSQQQEYAFLPKALAQRIDEKMTGFIIQQHNQQNDQTTDEDDPYADYVIPDDLMW
ncbi:MAG: DUF2058 domain-containing protein [Acinetobacter sp.]|nr:DUF2058 domain-containing protein [Acinetobacter sp.]